MVLYTLLQVIITNKKQGCEHYLSPPITLTRPLSFIQLLRWKPILPSALQPVQWNSWFCGQWLNEVPVLQTTHSGTMMVLLYRNQKAYAKLHFHFSLNTTLPASKHLNGSQISISVEGHTDWITVTILMCELQVLVTGCSGHTDLNENQTTHSIGSQLLRS